jgi:hypothetical protein
LILLKIPSQAKRTANLKNRKCRAQFADVLWIQGGNHIIVHSDGLGKGKLTEYKVGKRVFSDIYCDDIRVDCSHGIHFFLTKEEAEEFLT